MSFDKASAVEAAKGDLAKRLGISESQVNERSVKDREFPDMALGAPENGEMAAQMISSGWEIELEAGGRVYDYRADKYHLRVHNFNGQNHVIKG
jgi:hypothetical protein